jgi:hypothetical protein
VTSVFSPGRPITDGSADCMLREQVVICLWHGVRTNIHYYYQLLDVGVSCLHIHCGTKINEITLLFPK